MSLMTMIDTNKLIAEQIKLAKKVIISDKVKSIKLIGGVEQAFDQNKVLSSIVVCNAKDYKVLEEKNAMAEAKIPYISGYRFYREGPTMIEAFSKLEQKPDVLIVNGNGILHPRRIGIASHIGILLDIPTIGVSKKLMLGEMKENTIYVEKEARGYQIVTKEHAKPLFISPGHMVSLKTSFEIIKSCIKYPHKLPEPLHLAHKYASNAMDKLEKTENKQ